ncbi:MAG: hypothetical protein EA379_08095 [Phycisphaerales bacterium]|nr:MAG: hypothetical protein EA379_08095 [Phycisphaerales bacterium]
MQTSITHARRATARLPIAAALVLSAGALAGADCATHAHTIEEAFVAVPALAAAIEAVSAKSDDAAATRRNILHNLTFSPTCYPNDLTREEWQNILERYQGLPPTQLAPVPAGDERFFTDTIVWQGNRGQGPSGQAAATFLTYSFPDDGTTWGLSQISATGPNDLNAKLIAQFGAGNLDLGREYFRAALASWRANTGLDYDESPDDNTPMTQDVTPVSTRGDIRIGGREFGTGSFLAYNAFPNAAGFAGVGGGDMVMNTSFFIAANFNNPANDYRYLRNTVAHEHGHGTGFIHVTPCNGTKLMEPSISTNFDVVGVDEKRGAGRNYGDRHAGNHSAANAVDYGDLASPITRSVIERDLSLNTATGPNNTNQDWFRFTLSSSQPVVLTATPTGGTYSNGQQFFGCFGSNSTINANSAGNITLELRDASGANVLDSSAGSPGGARTVNAGTLSAGEYTVRVIDVGPNSNQNIQLYDLSIAVDNAPAPPFAVAGINKRVAANTNCFFLGDINSRVNQPGATLSAASYDWDLTGDGVIDAAGQPKPVTQYVSNGVYNVTLHLTDSNNMTATDTITVTVVGATTAVTDVNPPAGDQGASVPVVITGTNFKNVASASEVTVSGSGVSVTGTPVPNAAGTEISGLSFVIDAGATLGARTITVANSDGSASGVGLFTVDAASVSCPGDFNGDLVVDFDDLSIVLGGFGAAFDFADLSEVLANFGVDCN